MVIAYCFLHAIIILLAFLPFLYTTYLGLFPNHIPNPEDKTAMMSITQAVLDNKADLGIIFLSQFAVALPYQFAKHAMSIYANKHTSIDKPRQCTLGKASGTSDGAASSKQRAAAMWIRTCQV